MIAFLDADDRWHPEFLAIIAGLAARHPDGAIYATNYELAEADGVLYPGLDRIDAFVGADDRLDLFAALAAWQFPVTSSSVAVPKARFNEAGLFDERLSLGTDTHMWIRLASSGPAWFDLRPGAVYHRDALDRSTAQPAFWDKRLFLADVLDDTLAGLAMNPRDRRALHRHIRHMVYEALVHRHAESPAQFVRALAARRNQLSPIYLARGGAHLVKRTLRGRIRKADQGVNA